ncbi:hypothetical protein VA599_23640 [Chromobacterium sp. TRC.1.1.SA]|uniref:MotA/TolQ/ExbB proton channel domain-containing protein n=1 Tax=Chromobacterium indicum TaxID=3110228 RepID=A0ABV0CRW3_9NEIS
MKIASLIPRGFVVLNSILRLVSGYGGVCAIFMTLHFWISVVMLLLTMQYWMRHEWWGQVLNTIPTLLGFSIGGFAIFISLGDHDFKKALCHELESAAEGTPTTFKTITTQICLASLSQALAMLVAILANAILADCKPYLNQYFVFAFNMVGYWVFLYSVCFLVDVIVTIFNIAEMNEKYIQFVLGKGRKK